MGTAYKELANRLFTRIKDRDFLKMSEDTAYEIVIDYIKSACVMFKDCTQDLSDRNDETQEFNFKLNNDNFTLLVNYMIIIWLESNFILTSHALKARLTSTEFRALGLKDMLSKTMELKRELLNENDRLAIEKSYSSEMAKIYDVATGKV